MDLNSALNHCVKSLKTVSEQEIPLDGLEVAILDRNRHGRKFRRLLQSEFTPLLS
jgi:proteasome alpha subunit